jgi:hypothetical protein
MVTRLSIRHVTPFRPLQHGEILDLGYGEFMCTPAFAEELLDGGMTHVNGHRVTLQVVDRGLLGVGAVIVRVTELTAAMTARDDPVASPLPEYERWGEEIAA